MRQCRKQRWGESQLLGHLVLELSAWECPVPSSEAANFGDKEMMKDMAQGGCQFQPVPAALCQGHYCFVRFFGVYVVCPPAKLCNFIYKMMKC